MLQLTVTPQSALVDEPLQIQVTGLQPSQLVTFHATLIDEKGQPFRSRAFYQADAAGEVDLEKASALGGDYVGVHPMGLFWTLKPKKTFSRLMKQDVINTPYHVKLEVYNMVLLDFLIEDQPLISTTVERWYAGAGVKRIQIREGRVRGALFLPPGEGPFPGIIDLFGGIGGLVEFRASLLASRGFIVLALAYFKYEDLPQSTSLVDLEYFEEAANLLLKHPKVLGSGIGVIAICKGAEIGLSMAIHLKQITALVCINGPNIILEGVHKYQDDCIQAPLPSLEKIRVERFGLISMYDSIEMIREKGGRNALPVEKFQGHILFIVGEDDKNYNSKAFAEAAMEQLKKHGKNSGKLLSYPGAGHLIEPPYSPLCFASWNAIFKFPLVWGGKYISHATAQEHSWREIQKFFRHHLTQNQAPKL
ncbi:bile acid-CoA:amino acid N-acyltransferase [Ornithorhynchus anatinus]|uniref:Bile acid-CoA:amino acid N-acyltransferase n=1 Tax=Ornithorhynchus anatinus TaxID=9258 RepID=A0A6I8PRD6_ORNAN|nr:bile acid-CoA:amino acid N-acyltransferase [Ornithorhynchus anatinus]XP_028912015.1 bile acid-CoA:amino acid N-acyltransferase [Ornithorhynchus anatinus]